MRKNGPALRGVGGALCVLMVAAGCQDAVTSTHSARIVAPSLSRVAAAAPGRHLFLMNGNIPADFSSQVSARGGTVVNSLDAIGVVVTEGLSDADATAIAGRNAVVPDFVAQWIPTPDDMQVSTASLSTPVSVTSVKSPLTAAFLPFQWNMMQIHAPQAWAATASNPGTTTRVAILDTGLDPYHLDQAGLIDFSKSVAFVPSTMGPPPWADDNFHGTFVGGIVTSNNFGTAGVAPNVRLIAVKILNDSGAGSFATMIAGILWATDSAKAQVINLSVGALVPRSTKAFANGGPTVLSIMNRVLNYAKRSGVLVVSAAGNESIDLQHDSSYVELPCEAGVQLCVSATGNGDTHASYSNFGTSAINVAAPGGDGPATTATWILGPCSSRSAIAPFSVVCKDGFHYIIAIGTSASAPHVSGLGAYLDSQFGGTLNPSQLITLIQQNADDIGKPGTDPFFGKGRINVFNTVTTTQP